MEMKDEIKLKELENEKKRLDNQKELIELVKEFKTTGFKFYT